MFAYLRKSSTLRRSRYLKKDSYDNPWLPFFSVKELFKEIQFLDWLCEHGQIDMLAMVHRKHDFLDSILYGSHTKKMAGHINIPLLIYPGRK